MTKIIVNRHQYGVGQGGFHFQKIGLAGKNSDKNSFCFVYDCGGKKDVLDWCIQHVAKDAKKLTLNAVYISHFEQDHVNGLKELCDKTTVKRFFVPYIDDEISIYLIAKQVSSGVTITQEYIADLFAVARGESIHRVPVTRIASEITGAPSLLNDENTDSNPDNEIYTIDSDIADDKQILNSKSVQIKVGKNQTIWELVHWCYAPYPKLSNVILEKLQNKFPCFNEEVKTGFLKNATAIEANKVAEWIENNRGEIKKCYDDAIREINKSPPRGYTRIPVNHNVVSLCLYSGPISKKCELQGYDSFPKTLQYYCCFLEHEACFRYGGAWLGTGDAMLKRADVWGKFNRFFKDRLDACSTVVIPHHGANSISSDNYNEKLIKPLRNCVISAGATNPYHHPHISVIQDILSRNGILHLVSENTPLGFVEHIEFEIFARTAVKKDYIRRA